MKGWTSRISPQKPHWLMPQKSPSFLVVFFSHQSIFAPKGRNHALRLPARPLKSRQSRKEISSSKHPFSEGTKQNEIHQNLPKNSSFRSSNMYTIKSSVHIFLFSSQTPQKINQPNQPTDFFVSLETNQWQWPMAFPPRQKRGHVTPAQGGALCFLGCAFTRTMEIFISGSTASSFFDAPGVKLLCWEKIGLNVGHFQMSKICMFQEHFLEQDACLLLYRSGKCPYII